MNDKEKEENILSKFSNQDPASGGYGEREAAESQSPTRSKTASVKAKKKKKNKTAKKSRKKNRR